MTTTRKLADAPSGGSSTAASAEAASARAAAAPSASRLFTWWTIAAGSHSGLLVAAVVIGSLTAVANVVFQWAIAGAHELFWVDLGGFLAVDDIHRYDVFVSGRAAIPDNWWFIPLIPMAGMAVIVFLDRFFPGEMKGYGLPRFLELVNIRGGYLRRRWITLKTISVAITVGSGMSAGLEGPIAQIGGAIGSTVGRALRPSFERLRTLIACGSAAAIAASFGAPIAGVMFAQEVVLIGEVAAQSFYLIVLAAGTSAVVSQYVRADFALLRTPPGLDFPLDHGLLLMVVMGIATGMLAVVFIRVFYGVRDLCERAPLPKPVVAILGGAVVGCTLIFFPQVGGGGYDTINAAFRGALNAPLLWALVALKILMTSVTLGAGGAGGVFAPAMFVGATFGGGFAAVVEALAPGTIHDPGAYALVGLGAMLAAATHAPMTAIFLLIELTRDYESAVPAMITAVTATIVARQMMHDSVDTYDLTRRGLDVHAGSEANILRSLSIRGLVSKDFQQVPASMPLTDFVRYVTNSHHDHFPVVDAVGDVAGVVRMQDLRAVLLDREAWPYVVVGELAQRPVVTVRGSDTMHEAMKIIAAQDLEQIPVVDEESGRKVVGMLKRSELQNFYQKRLLARELHG